MAYLVNVNKCLRNDTNPAHTLSENRGINTSQLILWGHYKAKDIIRKRKLQTNITSEDKLSKSLMGTATKNSKTTSPI